MEILAYGTGTVHNVWLEYNVVKGGEKGMEIHADISAYGVKSNKIRLQAYFYDENKDKLMGGVSGYKTKSGHVCVFKSSTSTYDNCRWEDFVLFIPYRAIPMEAGDHDYYVKVTMYDMTQKKFISPMSNYFGFVGTGSGRSNKNRYQSNNNQRRKNSNSSDRTWRTENSYGGFSINKVKNGIRTETVYGKCSACRGTTVCRNCNSTGKCPVCYGAGYHNSFGMYRSCLMCNGRGACNICKGSGNCLCANNEYPGYLPSYASYYDADGNLRNTVSFMVNSSSSSTSSSESHSSSSTSSSSSSGSCYVCHGTGVDPSPFRGNSMTSWLKYTNGSGDDCPYCNSYDHHQHLRCAHCNTPSR